MKKFYVTKKQVDKYIESTQKEFKDKQEFIDELKNSIENLSEFPEDHKAQIKFFSRVLEKLEK